jgi:hypothetical protein
MAFPAPYTTLNQQHYNLVHQIIDPDQIVSYRNGPATGLLRTPGDDVSFGAGPGLPAGPSR